MELGSDGDDHYAKLVPPESSTCKRNGEKIENPQGSVKYYLEGHGWTKERKAEELLDSICSGTDYNEKGLNLGMDSWKTRTAKWCGGARA